MSTYSCDFTLNCRTFFNSHHKREKGCFRGVVFNVLNCDIVVRTSDVLLRLLHNWRSKDKYIRNVLFWTPKYGGSRVVWPARIFVNLHFTDTICNLESLACHTTHSWRCPWCNGYRCRKWTRRHEFKSWTRLIAFHIALIPSSYG